MQKADVEKYKKRLLAMRQRLTTEVTRIEEAISEDVVAAGDLSSVPTHNADFDSEGVDDNIALAQNEEGILEAVEEALERIESGNYGRCQECGKDIASERLNAVPYTAHCVACAKKLEDR